VGSQAKLNGLDGAAYVIEVVEAIGRGTRPAISVVVGPPIDAGATSADQAAGPRRLTALMERVSRTLEDASCALSGKGIENRTTGNAARLREATRTLVAEGFAEVVEGARGDEFASVRAYRSEEDPASDNYLGWAIGGTPPASTSSPRPDLVLTSSSGVRTTSSPDPSPPTGRGRGSSDAETVDLVLTSSSSTDGSEGHVLVSCKSCFRPTEQAEADGFGGRCGKCAQLAGLVTE
jgi:hypothetical protein